MGRTGAGLGACACLTVAVATIVEGPAASYPSGAPRSRDDNADLVRLYEEDQADRTQPAGREIDWSTVGPRDRAREARVKALYEAAQLHTAADFHHAAMILQHAEASDDFLLAHELCIVAIAKGDSSALWLCAATEDRFLMNIGREQRFGTQYRSEGPGGAFRLVPVADKVTDALRAEFHAPTLEQAKKREADFNAPAGKPQ